MGIQVTAFKETFESSIFEKRISKSKHFALVVPVKSIKLDITRVDARLISQLLITEFQRIIKLENIQHVLSRLLIKYISEIIKHLAVKPFVAISQICSNFHVGVRLVAALQRIETRQDKISY